jgi:undecaprenyl phosphate-alpha-L-ara4N flippase subunit ArnE
MLKVVILTIVQCFLLACGQVCFKFAVSGISGFRFAWDYFYAILTNWWLLASGACLVCATILWGCILKHFEFSAAYPITAFAYVFGMLAAVFVFHESVPMTRWIGVCLIIAGVIFIAK